MTLPKLIEIICAAASTGSVVTSFAWMLALLVFDVDPKERQQRKIERIKKQQAKLEEEKRNLLLERGLKAIQPYLPRG